MHSLMNATDRGCNDGRDRELQRPQQRRSATAQRSQRRHRLRDRVGADDAKAADIDEKRDRDPEALARPGRCGQYQHQTRHGL